LINELAKHVKMIRFSPNQNIEWKSALCKLVAGLGNGFLPPIQKRQENVFHVNMEHSNLSPTTKWGGVLLTRTAQQENSFHKTLAWAIELAMHARKTVIKAALNTKKRNVHRNHCAGVAKK